MGFMLRKPRFWLPLGVVVLAFLGSARPATAEKYAIQARAVGLEVYIELDGACLCAPEANVGTPACAEYSCDFEQLTAAKAEVGVQGIEIVLAGAMPSGDSMVQVVGMVHPGQVDPQAPYEPRVRGTTAGFLEGFVNKRSGARHHGLDDPDEDFDMGVLDGVPFASFVITQDDLHTVTYLLFGTRGMVAYMVTGASDEHEAARALAFELAKSSRLPASTSVRTNAAFERGYAVGRVLGMVFALGLLWLVIRGASRLFLGTKP